MLVDDIDRLEKSEIQALFRLLKLSADFKNVTYILAFDDAMVAAALGERFETDPNKQFLAGQHFLEKIVQVGLNLPPSSKESLQEYTFELVQKTISESAVEFTQEQGNDVASALQIGVLPRLKTPRMANRYANALEFSLTLLRGEVDTGDLILIEALRIFYPRLYSQVRTAKDLMLSEDRKDFTCDIFVKEHGLLEELSERAAAVWLLNTLFPRTKTTHYGGDWEAIWSKKRKVCAESYFDRYFSYAIRRSDISDQVVLKIIALARSGDPDKVREEVCRVTEGNASRFLEKLRSYESTIEPVASIVLISSLVAIAAKLPLSDGMGFFTSPSLQGCFLIRRLLLNIPAEARLGIAIGMLPQITSLSFLCESMRWLSTGDDEKERVLSIEEDVKLRRAGATELLNRMSQDEEPIFKTSPKNARRFLAMIAWGLGPEVARQYVRSWLQKSDNNIESFLISYLPTAYSVETGIPHISDLRLEAYNEICDLANCDQIEKYLHAKFGSEFDKASYHVEKNWLPLKKVAKQFLYFRQDLNLAEG